MQGEFDLVNSYELTVWLKVDSLRIKSLDEIYKMYNYKGILQYLRQLYL